MLQNTKRAQNPLFLKWQIPMKKKILKSLRYFAWVLCTTNLLSYAVLLFSSIALDSPPEFIQKDSETFIHFSLFSFGVLMISVLIFKIHIIHSNVEIAKYISAILFVINAVIGSLLYAFSNITPLFG